MKKILFIIAVFVIFIPMRMCAHTDSFYEGEYIPGAYIKKFRGNTGKYEQMRVFRRSSDNRVVYCLQLWEVMNSNRNITGYDTNQAAALNISDNVWNKIILISYYGYGYKNHTDIKWYAVTQFMIWQTLEYNSNIYFTDKLNGNKIDKFNDEINEINQLIKSHDVMPNIAKYSDYIYNICYYLSDRNSTGTMPYLDIIPSKGVEIRTVTENNVQFYVAEPINSSIKFVKSDKLYPNNPIVYIDDNSQNLLLPGKYNPLMIQTNIGIVKGGITINNIDCMNNVGDSDLSTTEIELYDYKNNYMFNAKADTNNEITLTNIPYGKYHFKIINPGIGYKADDKYYDIEIDQSNLYMKLCREQIKNIIQINKYIKNENDYIEKENAGFDVYNSRNENVLSFSTENGYYEFELPYGNYTLKQTTGKDNYTYVDDVNIKVTKDGEIQKFDLYDLEIPHVSEKRDVLESVIYEEIKDVPDTYKKCSVNVVSLLITGISLLYLKGKKYV